MDQNDIPLYYISMQIKSFWPSPMKEPFQSYSFCHYSGEEFCAGCFTVLKKMPGGLFHVCKPVLFSVSSGSSSCCGKLTRPKPSRWRESRRQTAAGPLFHMWSDSIRFENAEPVFWVLFLCTHTNVNSAQNKRTLLLSRGSWQSYADEVRDRSYLSDKPFRKAFWCSIGHSTDQMNSQLYAHGLHALSLQLGKALSVLHGWLASVCMISAGHWCENVPSHTFSTSRAWNTRLTQCQLLASESHIRWSATLLRLSNRLEMTNCTNKTCTALFKRAVCKNIKHLVKMRRIK